MRNFIWRSRTKILLALLVISLILPVSTFLNIDIHGSNISFTIGMDSAYAATFDLDYTCDGTTDDVQFQAALDALPSSGGEIKFLSGTYDFDATVSRAIDGVTFTGVGEGSLLNYNASNYLISAGSQTGWIFQNFSTDAGGVNISSATSSSIIGIWINGTYTLDYSNPEEIVRSATYVVATSNSLASSKAQADYLCNGTDDDVEIQAAIDALPTAGGTILLMEGTYSCTSLMELDQNGLTLAGMGWTTVINYDGTLTTAQQCFLEVQEASDVTVRDLKIDTKQKTEYAIGTKAVWDLGGSNSYRVKFERLHVTDGWDDVIQISCVHDVWVRDCYIYRTVADAGGTYACIEVEDDCHNVWVEGNTIVCPGTNPYETYGISTHAHQPLSPTDVHIINNNIDCRFYGIIVADKYQGFLDIRGNTITNTYPSGGIVVNVTSTGSEGMSIRYNHIEVDNIGIKITAVPSLTVGTVPIIEDNHIVSGGNGIQLDSGAYNCLVRRNTIESGAISISNSGVNSTIVNNDDYIDSGEIRTSLDSLTAGTVGNCIAIWQNPWFQSVMVTGRTRITTGATAASTGDWGLATTVEVLDDCEDYSVWSIHSDSTGDATITEDSDDYVERGTYNIMIDMSAAVGANKIIAFSTEPANLDISTAEYITLKIRTTSACDAGELQLGIDQANDMGTATFYDLPALSANTITLVCLNLNGGAAVGAGANSISAVGVKDTVGDTVRDIYVDDIRAITVGTDLLNGGDLQATGNLAYQTTSPVHVDYKNNDDATHHDTLVFVSAANDSTGLVGSYYINAQGE